METILDYLAQKPSHVAVQYLSHKTRSIYTYDNGVKALLDWYPDQVNQEFWIIDHAGLAFSLDRLTLR